MIHIGIKPPIGTPQAQPNLEDCPSLTLMRDHAEPSRKKFRPGTNNIPKYPIDPICPYRAKTRSCKTGTRQERTSDCSRPREILCTAIDWGSPRYKVDTIRRMIIVPILRPSKIPSWPRRVSTPNSQRRRRHTFHSRTATLSTGWHIQNSPAVELPQTYQF